MKTLVGFVAGLAVAALGIYLSLVNWQIALPIVNVILIILDRHGFPITVG